MEKINFIFNNPNTKEETYELLIHILARNIFEKIKNIKKENI